MFVATNAYLRNQRKEHEKRGGQPWIQSLNRWSETAWPGTAILCGASAIWIASLLCPHRARVPRAASCPTQKPPQVGRSARGSSCPWLQKQYCPSTRQTERRAACHWCPNPGRRLDQLLSVRFSRISCPFGAS